MADIILPDIESISARGWESEDDWSVIARLFDANKRAIGVHLHVTTDEVRGWLADADDIDQDNDYVFIDVAGETIAYSLTRTYVEHHGRRIYGHSCNVDPAWQGKGIGTALFDWILAYNTERAGTLGPGTLQTDVDNDDPAPTALLVAAGYEPVQHEAELVRPDLDNIPDAQLPEGVETRSVEKSHLRAIYESDHQAFKDHWGSRVRTEGDWKAFLNFAHRDESLWAVAWDGDRVVGQVRGYVNAEENEVYNRKRGWAEFISTARDWRGKGVASALICNTLRAFRERGLEEAALGVHVENPTGAFRLYQRLGFEVTTTGAIYERPIAARTSI